jgi:hypothetical protein
MTFNMTDKWSFVIVAKIYVTIFIRASKRHYKLNLKKNQMNFVRDEVRINNNKKYNVNK